jgi:hypothetical protein
VVRISKIVNDAVGLADLTEDNDAPRRFLGMLSRTLSKSTDEFRFEQVGDSEPIGANTDLEITATPAVLESVGQSVDIDGLPTELPSRSAPKPPRKVSASKVQSLILQALRQVSGFPESGVAVTVYGFRPWNAMLNFAPRSTSYNEAIVFRKALAEIVQELRIRVEVDIDQDD